MRGRKALLVAIAILLVPGRVSAADLAQLRNGFSIRHDHRQVLGDITRLFLETSDTSYIDVPTMQILGFEKDLSPSPPDTASAKSRSPVDLTQVVDSASSAYHLDPDLIRSVIHAESSAHPNAVSRKGAQGLMQLMPGTAVRLGVADPFDPQANVSGGTRYLRQLLERYNFDLLKALAAYNAGPLRVEQYRGVPPYRETRAYVSRVVREYNRKKIAQEKQAAAQSKARRPAKTNLKSATSRAVAGNQPNERQ